MLKYSRGNFRAKMFMYIFYFQLNPQKQTNFELEVLQTTTVSPVIKAYYKYRRLTTGAAKYIFSSPLITFFNNLSR